MSNTKKYRAEDFGYTANAEGYMLTYKGKPIGGASIMGKSKARGKAKQQQVRDYIDSANREIQSIVNTGHAAVYLKKAMDYIDWIETLQDKINEAGYPHVTVIDIDKVKCVVDDEMEVFHRTDVYSGHPMSGYANYGCIGGDHRMISAIAEDMETVFNLLTENKFEDAK